jgi:hypothetical protein
VCHEYEEIDLHSDECEEREPSSNPSESMPAATQISRLVRLSRKTHVNLRLLQFTSGDKFHVQPLAAIQQSMHCAAIPGFEQRTPWTVNTFAPRKSNRIGSGKSVPRISRLVMAHYLPSEALGLLGPAKEEPVD